MTAETRGMGLLRCCSQGREVHVDPPRMKADGVKGCEDQKGFEPLVRQGIAQIRLGGCRYRL